MEDFDENDIKLILDALDAKLELIEEDSRNQYYKDRKEEVLSNIKAYVRLRNKLYGRFA